MELLEGMLGEQAVKISCDRGVGSHSHDGIGTMIEPN
jgi:hypothetical protein